MTRRDFICSGAAFAALGARGESAVPRMRLGLIADTHIVLNDSGKGLQNCLCFEPALRYFDQRKADGVLIAGDLTDFGTAAELRHFASIWNKVFPGNRRSDGGSVVPLFIFGDHDMGGYMHNYSWAPKDEVAGGVIPEMDVAALWRECFNEEWSPIQVKECCGFKFVLAHHPRHTAESDNGNSIPGLADFMAAQTFDPSKPFFFVQHRIFKDTVLAEGCGWENGKTTATLKNYPNAIAFCGHGHCNAADELCLWQDEFTAIQIPSINFCCTRPGRENGYNSLDTGAIMPKGEIRKSWQGMFATMYADRLVIERRDFLNGLPLGPDWTIPLPCPDGSLKTDLRARLSRPPNFSPCAKLLTSCKTVVNKAGVATDAVVVSFPVARRGMPASRAFDYVVTAKKDDRIIKEKYVFSKGQFWTESRDTLCVECAFAMSDLPDDWRTSVRFAVAPRDSFGNCGRMITT
ncbi:MAG: metallophosphoesterase [Kiritimatiellae bacterium]|nr:metallophosphoesterase [Kiritimatiellia bacterium]